MSGTLYKVVVLALVGILVAGAVVYKMTSGKKASGEGQISGTGTQPDGTGPPDVAEGRKLPTAMYFGRFV